MAYKFSLGKYKHSGSLVSADSLTVSNGTVALPNSVIDNAELAGGITNDKLVNNTIKFNGVTVVLGESGSFGTDAVTEGMTNKYYTDGRARAAVGADGNGLEYNSATGQFRLELDGTGLVTSSSGLKLDLEAEVAEASGSGSLAVDNASGKITLTPASPAWAKGLLSASDFVTYDSTSGGISVNASAFTGSARRVVSAVNDLASGSGSLAYDSATGIIKLSPASPAWAKNLFGKADTSEISMSYADGVYSAEIKTSSIANTKLVNSKVTVNGHDIALGGAYTLDTVDLASFSGSVQDKMNSYLTGGSGLAYAAGTFDVNVAGGIKILGDSVAIHTGAIGDGILFTTGAVADAVAKIAVAYGSTAKTAVQGNQTWSIAAGSGLTGDGSGQLGAGLSTTLAVGAGNGIEVLTDAVQVKLSGGNSNDALVVNANGLDLKATISGSRTFQNDITVQGNLYVNGNTFSASVGQLLVEDANIVIADGAPALSASQGFTIGAGLATFQVGDGTATNSAFVSSLELKAPKFVGSMVGTITEGVQDVSGSATAAKSIVLCNAASAGFTLSLPTAADWNGMSMKIKKSDLTENGVTIAASSGQKIDSVTSIVLDSPYAAVMLVSNGANWFVF